MPHPLNQLPPNRPHAGAVLPPPRADVSSLYIHVPFCFHKCHYCDFYSLVDTRDRQPAFVARLTDELRALAPWAGALDTIFVGGGTPSLLAPHLWEQLLSRLASSYDLSSLSEFTVECNPETVTPDLGAVLAAGGVTRVSMGAQSFDREHLKTLERWHDPDKVPEALHIARGAGIPRASLDLIFGIPGQSVADWERDVQAALSLGLSHLSCYNLTYEPGTAMTARLSRGQVTPAPEDDEVEMFRRTPALLAPAGLRRYEVSNFAAPGDECRHNLVYWRQGQWLAAGPSASGHVAGVRWKNAPRLDDYLSQGEAGFSPVVDVEPPDPRRALAEVLMTGLRLSEGVDAASALTEAERVSPGAAARLLTTADAARRAGHLEAATSAWRLTEPGLLVSQSVIVDFMSALDPA